MAKNGVKIKSLSTNVRYIKTRQKVICFLLTALWYVAPRAAKNIILKSFFKPKSYALTPLEKQFLASSTPFQMYVHGKTIRCWKSGSGPAILFVHGWNGRGANLAYFFKPVLDAGYSVIFYDAPAHGESQGQVTNYFELSDTIRSFLDPSRGFDIKGIVAYSIGASAAINCLSKDKRDVDVVLLAPALKLKQILFHAFHSHGVPQLVYQGLIADLERYYGYDVHADNPDVLAKTVATQMLVVHDKDDRTIPYADTKMLSEKSDTVHLYTTEGLGHKWILKDNDVVKVVTAYLFNGKSEPKMKNAASIPKENKMMDHKSITEEYRNADSEKRLYLFLSHRSLREEFLKIDQDNLSATQSAEPVKNKCRMCCGNWGKS